MKRLLCVFGVAFLLVFSSCTKKAADAIVGHWSVYNYYHEGPPDEIWEFDSDGTVRFVLDGHLYEGWYSVNGSDIRLSYHSYDDYQIIAKITYMNEDRMRWITSDATTLSFWRTVESISDYDHWVITYDIGADVNPYDGGQVYGAGTYEKNRYCSLNAVANPGYHFSSWTENGEVVSRDPYYSFMVTEDRYLTANFLPGSYYINARPDPSQGGSVVGGGYFEEFDYCSLEAIPYQGYHFTHWTEYGDVVSTDPQYSFVVERARELWANFEPNEAYYVNVSTNPYEGGYVTGGGIYETGEGYYDENELCSLTAMANPGYVFTNWTEYGEVISWDPYYSFTVQGDRWLQANFARMIAVNAMANPVEGGTVVGSGYYYEYDDCTVEAIANPGYYFVNWTEQGYEVSTDPIYSFFADYDRNLMANFELIPEDARRIAVTGDTWFVLDHQYVQGESIHLEHVTFALRQTLSGVPQQLIGGGEGESLRIGQKALPNVSVRGCVCFDIGRGDDWYEYQHLPTGGNSVLRDAELVFSPTCIWINGTLADYYDKRLLDLSTNLCLFADNEYGDDVVQNQTATIGAVTITDAYGNVTAKYLPMIDGNGTPCLFNPVSGAYIYHRGGGIPVVTYGIKDY